MDVLRAAACSCAVPGTRSPVFTPSSVRALHALPRSPPDAAGRDIKIGLLVRNRLELEDVVKQSRLLKKRQRQGGTLDIHTASSGTSLKSLNKAARERLESYQHLFYLLQTNPSYLAHLVFMEKPIEGKMASLVCFNLSLSLHLPCFFSLALVLALAFDPVLVFVFLPVSVPFLVSAPCPFSLYLRLSLSLSLIPLFTDP